MKNNNSKNKINVVIYENLVYQKINKKSLLNKNTILYLYYINNIK